MTSAKLAQITIFDLPFSSFSLRLGREHDGARRTERGRRRGIGDAAEDGAQHRDDEDQRREDDAQKLVARMRITASRTP